MPLLAAQIITFIKKPSRLEEKKAHYWLLRLILPLITFDGREKVQIITPIKKPVEFGG